MPKAYPYTPPTREELLVSTYGECCRKSVAAKILGRSAGFINSMLSDGRIKAVCEGKMVDVRSIARYMDVAPQADYVARQRKRGRNPSMVVVPSRRAP